MPYRDLEPVSKQLTIVVGLTVVGFMAFGLALSFYRNILFEDTLRRIEAENGALQDAIVESQRNLEYYRSAQYKDKYAKENLSRLSPGEKILVITEQPQTPDVAAGESLTSTEAQEAAYQELLRQMPILQHWRLYLFDREAIDRLKRGL